MAITKLGFLGGVTGAIRASNLSDKNKATFSKEYKLPDDTNFIVRNLGRGAAGDALGVGAGILAGSLGGAAARGMSGDSIAAVLGLPIGVATYLATLKKMTDKYSVGRARALAEQSG